MSDALDTLVDRIRELQKGLEEEFDRRREEIDYQMEKGKAVFSKEIATRHKALKTGILRYLATARPLVVLTAPVIYSVAIPLLLLDLFVSIYQRVCFPIYGIERVKRSDYVVFDRHRLQYLNGLERFNCIYCSYANGLIAYVREIAGRTERYWCPIRHARAIPDAHGHYHQFSEYGDAEGYLDRISNDRSQST